MKLTEENIQPTKVEKCPNCGHTKFDLLDYEYVCRNCGQIIKQTMD
jgi:DNA-directed RNA polymerase subunit RPC12/RpoP